MRLKYIPEFAAMLAAHSSIIARDRQRLTSDVVGRGYLAFRDRSNHLMQEIDRCVQSPSVEAESLLANRHPLVDLAERVLMNDILTRVWCTLLVKSDAVLDQKLEAIARNLHLNQLIVRHRVLSRVVSTAGPTTEDVRYVNQLRQKVERWTDRLLGPFATRTLLDDFAFDSKRAFDFGLSCGSQSVGPNDSVWQLALVGIRTAFDSDIPRSSAVSPDDRRVIHSIVRGVDESVSGFTEADLEFGDSVYKPLMS